MAQWSDTIKVLRRIISELRHATPNGKVADSLQVRYIFNQYRKYKVTDQQICRAHEEMNFIANTYLCHLTSMRRYNEINNKYKGSGERSIRETADIVGFKLPEDPK